MGQLSDLAKNTQLTEGRSGFSETSPTSSFSFSSWTFAPFLLSVLTELPEKLEVRTQIGNKL